VDETEREAVVEPIAPTNTCSRAERARDLSALEGWVGRRSVEQVVDDARVVVVDDGEALGPSS
jgi:hypothetical protein